LINRHFNVSIVNRIVRNRSRRNS